MKKFYLVLIILFLSLMGFAQEKETNLSTDASFGVFSKYVFRGVEIGTDPCIQGGVSVTYDGLTMGFWASNNFSGTYFEPNFYFEYSISNFIITLYDYDVGQGIDFFNYNTDETTHSDEIMVTYTISDDFPLSLSLATIFYGADKKLDYIDAITGEVFLKNNFSTYIEASYPFQINENTISVTGGITTHESGFYASDSFALINLGFSFEKSINVSESFSLPVGFSFIINPELGRAYCVMSLSF